MADETTNPTDDPRNTPELYARAARDAADEANRALEEMRRLAARIDANRPVPAAPAALRAPARATAPAEEDDGAPVEYPVRRKKDRVSSQSCLCGAPLYSHNPDAPYDCPETECKEFRLSRA